MHLNVYILNNYIIIINNINIGDLKTKYYIYIIVYIHINDN